MKWTDEAWRILQDVPEGRMREMTRQRIEKHAESQEKDTVTADVAREKYAVWEKGSAMQQMKLEWEEALKERIQRIPSFIRGMVVKELESAALEKGLEKMTLSFYEHQVGEMMDKMQFHHPPTVNTQAINEDTGMATAKKRVKPAADQQILQLSGWKKITIPVDNSAPSDRAANIAVHLTASLDADLEGIHIFDFKIHEKRFAALMPLLSKKYQKQKTYDRLEVKHDNVMDLSLKLLGESFLEKVEREAKKHDINYQSQVIDGRPADGICRYLRNNNTDLVIMGATGQGENTRAGGCTRKVVRRNKNRDFLLVREDAPASGEIVVAIDGSDHSFTALRKGLVLAQCYQLPVTAVAAYDLALHETIFNSMKNVLSEKADKVFGSEKQEKMHEEIIDDGIKKVYQKSLDKAEEEAYKKTGKEINTVALQGRGDEELIRYCRENNPAFLVFGRYGLHRTEETDIGSIAETLIYEAPCNLLCCTENQKNNQ